MVAHPHEPESSPFPVGSCILAKIHTIELQHGIFIPGHRFEPLRNLSTVPWLLRLEDTDKGVFKSRKISLSMRDAELFHMLFGKPNFMFLLVHQDKFNMKVLEQLSEGTGADSALVRIQAYDFSKFYESNHLSAGDYLLFEAIEPAGDAFKVAPVPAASIAKTRRDSHFAAFDRGVNAALESLDGPTEPSLMIREIYRQCDSVILEKPAAAFSEYIGTTKKLGISDFGGNSYMWKGGENIVPAMLSHDGELPEDATELEEIMDACGLSISEAEIEAFVCDALYHKRKARSGFDRIIEGIEVFGIPDETIMELKRLGYELADDVAETYDRSGEIARYARLRTELVELYAQFLVWMRQMGTVMQSHEDIETREFSVLSEHMSGLCMALEFVNDIVDVDELDEEEGQTLAEIQRTLPSIRANVQGLMVDIERQLRNPKASPAPAKKTKAGPRK